MLIRQFTAVTMPYFITKKYLSIKNSLDINTFFINQTKIKRQMLKYVKFY